VPGEWVERDDRSEGTAASRESAVLHVTTLDDPYYPPERTAGLRAMLGARFRLARHAKYEGIHRAPSASFPEIRSFLAAEG
jgi:hypothetical protein